MLKRLLFGLFLTFVATPAMAQMTAASFVERAKPLEGKPLGDGSVILHGVRVEGSVAIVVLDSADWLGERDAVPQSFLQGFCSSGDDQHFFPGSQLRVDTMEAGADLVVGEVFRSCPATETGQ